MEHDDLLDKMLTEYEDKMEELYDTAKSTAELDSSHQEVKTEILQSLPLKWRNFKGTNKVPTDFQKRLNDKLESTFRKLKRHFEKSKQREQNKVAGISATKDALMHYNDEMDKYFHNHPTASPKEIDMMHVKFSNAALAQAKLKAGTDLPTALLISLKQEIEHRRKVYYERAQIILKSSKDPAIGIDLGTTMCCVMVFYKGKCELVPNRSQGNSHTTPSYVAFHEDGTDTFGFVAKEQAYRHPETTVYDAKRMIGREWSDPKLQNDISKWPFEVINANGNPKIKTWDRMRYPHEISARLLTRFRLMAEDHLNLPRGSIKKAVITVPAYFTEPQRRATNDAATCAGLHVLNILSEPTAAAIAYSWERRNAGARRALIYDLGGGTFDIAVAKVDAYNVDILCVDGDTHLGGQDFDQLLMNYCIQQFQQQTGINLESGRNSPLKIKRDEARSALSRIKLQCEKAKERLTTAEFTNVEIDKIQGSHDMSVKITKATLETLVRPLIKTTIDIIERALLEAKTKGLTGKQDIDDVILVGGSTRMPMVMDMVAAFFNGKQLCKHINPDEAVAYGAAIQAAMLNKNEDIKNIEVNDVTPMSLGIECKGEVFSRLIPKNAKIPCEYSKPYYTSEDNQIGILFKVYQGEDPVSTNNNLLGKFNVNGFPPKPKREEKADVTMKIDAMGILHVDAVSKTTGNSNSITISADKMGMDSSTIARVIQECRGIKTY